MVRLGDLLIDVRTEIQRGIAAIEDAERESDVEGPSVRVTEVEIDFPFESASDRPPDAGSDEDQSVSELDVRPGGDGGTFSVKLATGGQRRLSTSELAGARDFEPTMRSEYSRVQPISRPTSQPSESDSAKEPPRDHPELIATPSNEEAGDDGGAESDTEDGELNRSDEHPDTPDEHPDTADEQPGMDDDQPGRAGEESDRDDDTSDDGDDESRNGGDVSRNGPDGSRNRDDEHGLDVGGTISEVHEPPGETVNRPVSRDEISIDREDVLDGGDGSRDRLGDDSLREADPDAVPGIGKRFKKRLRRQNITDVASLARSQPERIADVLNTSPNRAAPLVKKAELLALGVSPPLAKRLHEAEIDVERLSTEPPRELLSRFRQGIEETDSSNSSDSSGSSNIPDPVGLERRDFQWLQHRARREYDY